MKNWLRNWKTTLLGVSALFAVAPKLIEDPSNIMHPEIFAAIVTAVGLIVAKDSDKTGVIPPAAKPTVVPLVALLAVSLGMVGSARAQTRATTGQLRADAPAPAVMVVLTDGSVRVADLGVGLAIDTSGTRPIISSPSPATPRWRVTAFAPAAAQADYTLVDPPIGDLWIFWNGLLMRDGVDYTFDPATRVVHFTTGPPASGDQVQMRYTY